MSENDVHRDLFHDPGPGTRAPARPRRLPFLVVAAAVVLSAGVACGPGDATSGKATSGESGPGAQEAAEGPLTVADLTGTSLTEAVSTAEGQAWKSVSVHDASDARRGVEPTTAGWRVCFQAPAVGSTLRPDSAALVLYAVPERERCPLRPKAPRRILMPDLVGDRYDTARSTLRDLGVDHLRLRHAHTGGELQDDRDFEDWRVCRQSPEGGAEVATATGVSLWAIVPGQPCTKPKPKPKPKPGAASGGGPGEDSNGGSNSGGASGIGFGQFCAPVGAVAITADGRPAKCFMGKDGRARWSYNSG
ncbi:PASTA domain-containing protein [Streptomyces sanyensis]|uniref:PASTA domain-containing protein n=1 Tax=Streptomyces sanyensis TaxID=568869 RepID=UPI003D778FFC